MLHLGRGTRALEPREEAGLCVITTRVSPKASLFRSMRCTLCEGECELMAAGGQWMGPENTYCGMGREAREFSSGKKMRSSADSVNYSERKQLYRRK